MRRIGIILLLMLLSACTPGSPGPLPTGGDTQPFLRVTQWSGLLPPGAKFAMPTVSAFASGLMIVNGPPAGVIPAPVQRRLNIDGVRELLHAALDAGLGERIDYGSVRVADGGITTVTLTYGGQDFVSRIEALTVTDAEGLTADQRAARAKVAAFIARFSKLDSLSEQHYSGPAQPYAFTQLAIFALPSEPGSTAEPAKDWPLADPATTGQQVEFGSCIIVTGDHLRTVTDSAASAQPTTLWRSGEALYHLTFRPMLPAEPECDTFQ